MSAPVRHGRARIETYSEQVRKLEAGSAPVRHGRARIETIPAHYRLSFITCAPVRHGRARIETDEAGEINPDEIVRPSAMDGRGLKLRSLDPIRRNSHVRPSAMDGRGLKLFISRDSPTHSLCARPPWTGED